MITDWEVCGCRIRGSAIALDNRCSRAHLRNYLSEKHLTVFKDRLLSCYLVLSSVVWFVSKMLAIPGGLLVRVPPDGIGPGTLVVPVHGALHRHGPCTVQGLDED